MVKTHSAGKPSPCTVVMQAMSERHAIARDLPEVDADCLHCDQYLIRLELGGSLPKIHGLAGQAGQGTPGQGADLHQACGWSHHAAAGMGLRGQVCLMQRKGPDRQGCTAGFAVARTAPYAPSLPAVLPGEQAGHGPDTPPSAHSLQHARLRGTTGAASLGS